MPAGLAILLSIFETAELGRHPDAHIEDAEADSHAWRDPVNPALADVRAEDARILRTYLAALPR